jgi:hypothetical protein
MELVGRNIASTSMLLVACVIAATQSGCYSTGGQAQQSFRAPYDSAGYVPYQTGYANQQPAFAQPQQPQFSGNMNHGVPNYGAPNYGTNFGGNAGYPATQSGWQKAQQNLNPFNFAKTST